MLNKIAWSSSFFPLLWEWRAKCNAQVRQDGKKDDSSNGWIFGEAPKPLKIERQSDGKTMIIWLIGRIRAEDLEELKRQMDESAETKVLDLSEITIVDADVIPFLSLTEREGTRLVGCPLYVRGWIQRERAEDT